MGRGSDRATDSPQPNERAGKRRLTDGDGPTNSRSKRLGNTMIACNECKRRKVKCNGLKPCQRCDHLSLDCIFTRSCCSSSIQNIDEFVQMKDQVTLLQNQINDLRSTRFGSDMNPMSGSFVHPRDSGQLVASSSSTTLMTNTAVSSDKSDTNVPQFHGSTSSMYGIDIAKSTLQRIGITHGPTDNGPRSESRSMYTPTTSSQALNLSDDPLWAVDEAAALRLCRIYDEEIGIMYPHIDMKKVSKNVNVLFTSTFISISLSTGAGQLNFQGAEPLDSEDIMAVKMVLAIGLLLEGSGKSDLSQRLFDSVKDGINAKLVSSPNIKSVTLFILTAHFHFQKDEEAQAWRFIGIAARLCMEMGLHRKDSLTKSFPDKTEYLEAVRNFWVVYALDRRFSFGTGLPFALNDQDLDSSLPKPDDAFPYLKHITEFNHIAGKVWYENIAYMSGNNDRRDAIGFLDYQVLQWYSQLPESLTFNKDPLVEQRVPARGVRRLRFLMYLRKNQARISIYRPILYSAMSIQENREYAQTVVDVAKDTILTISGVNRVSDLYSTQQVCYNYFLIQALAVIFLAVCHAPVDFCDQTRDEFCAVLDLINGFNTDSYIAKRLWRTIRVLREIGDKIGLLTRNVSEHGQGMHSSSAGVGPAPAAMAGLTVHQIDSLSSFDQAYEGHVLGYSPENAYQMSGELTSLFEFAEGYGVLGLAAADGCNAYTGAGSELAEGGMGNAQEMNALLGSQQEFSRIIGQLF